MKKLLVLLLGMAVAVSASAGINKSPLPKNVAKNDGRKFKTEFVTPFQLNRVVEVKQTLRTPVTEQPEGELMTYVRSGNALFVDGQYITYGEQDGTIDLIFAADNKVWFKNLLYGCAGAYGDSYVYGTLSEDGTTISVPMGQSIFWSDSYQADVVLGWGTTAVSSSSIVFTVDATVTEAVFAVGEDGTLTLLNSGDAPSGSDYPGYEGTGIGSYWTDDNTFGALLDWNTVLTPGVGVPQNLVVTPASTSAYVTWDATNNAEGYDLRYRPYVDTSGNPIDCHFTLDGYEADLELGWAILDADGDGNAWGLTYNPNDDSDVCLYSDSYSGGALTPDNWLISPLTKLQGVCKFKIAHKSSYPEKLEVMIGMEDAIDGNTVYTDEFTTIATYTTEGNDFVEKTIDLSAYEGAKGYVVFRHYGTTDQWRLYLDDIFIGDPDSEVVEPAPWEYIVGLETNECTIGDLTPETTYEVQVMAYNGDQESDWTWIVEFTTLPEPVIPDVYMLGGNAQLWDPTNGTKFDYNAEDNIYTKTITFPDENNYFGFTTALAENNDDGGWAYIEPFRFGAVADDDNFIYYDSYNGQPLSLTWDEYKSFCIPAGEYNLTVDLTSMKLIIEKVVPAHNYDKGDVNHDHAVNIGDVTALIDHLLGVSAVCEICADVNGDSAVNIADVAALIDVLLAGNN